MLTVRSFVPATGWGVFLPLYDHLFALFMPERRVREHLVAACELFPGQRLLDVGCGTGSLLRMLAERYPFANMTGIDIDPRILRIAQHKSTLVPDHSVVWQSGSATQLPFEQSSFERIVTSFVFHHLTLVEKQKALAEMRLALVEGGMLLLADFAAAKNWVQRVAYLLVQVLDGWERTHANAAGRLPGLIEAAGFRNIHETLVCNSWLGTVRVYRAVK